MKRRRMLLYFSRNIRIYLEKKDINMGIDIGNNVIGIDIGNIIIGINIGNNIIGINLI